MIPLQYVLVNKLAEYPDKYSDLQLIPSTWEVSEVAHKAFEGTNHETKIILFSLLSAAFSPETLDKLQFSLILNQYQDWQIWFSWKDGSSYHGMDWKLVVDTVCNLFPHMAGSNISYLGAMVFVEN